MINARRKLPLESCRPRCGGGPVTTLVFRRRGCACESRDRAPDRRIRRGSRGEVGRADGSTTPRAPRARAARSGQIVIVGLDSYSVDRLCLFPNRRGAELSALVKELGVRFPLAFGGVKRTLASLVAYRRPLTPPLTRGGLWLLWPESQAFQQARARSSSGQSWVEWRVSVPSPTRRSSRPQVADSLAKARGGVGTRVGIPLGPPPTGCFSLYRSVIERVP
jgi:hypothetical protein